jgi:hypothetical protein
MTVPLLIASLHRVNTETEVQTFKPQERLTSKYVHSAGLNVRSGPSLSDGTLFPMSQDTLVQVFNTDTSGNFVKIKYNDTVGYVNGNYLRDFKINSIAVGNRSNTDWIKKPGETLYASEITYLGIQATVSTLNASSQAGVFKIKLIDPLGNLSARSSSPSGYSFSWESTIADGNIYLGGWGTSSGGFYYRGDWRVEIWYQSDSSDSYSNYRIASKTITLY